MATQYIFIQGTIDWAKGLATRDKKFGHYNAQLTVTSAVQKQLKDLKSEARFKDVEGGLVSFKIKRDHEKIIKGKLTEFGPPRVFLTDPNGNDVELDPRTVGNGSTVTAKLAMYDTNFGTRGTRLEAVRVDQLIEYVPENVIGTDEVPF